MATASVHVSVVVRFAPSPTGLLHLGGARTALFNWLFAEQTERTQGVRGKIYLRLEDTDPARSQETFARSIPEALHWLGLNWDGEIVRQSQRFDIYNKYLEQLEEQGKAYRCYCPPAQIEKSREMARAVGRQYRYPGTCIGLKAPPDDGAPYVLRLRVGESEARSVMDRVIGRIPVSGSDIDDFVITRSDGTPLYNFCCVVDDSLMGITHVIRGSDHLENTRKQALIYDALGFERPEFAHLPLVAGLSKRAGSESIQSFRDKGFLPEAVLNYVARLGWSHGNQEIFSVDELIELFRLEDVGHSTARVNPDKLVWINEQHLHRARADRLCSLVEPWLPTFNEENRGRIPPAIRIYKTRCSTLDELARSIAPCLVDDHLVSWDEKSSAKVFTDRIKVYFIELANLVERIEVYQRESLKKAMWEQLEARGFGFRKIAPACRLALTGVSDGPRLLDLMLVLGRRSVVLRLRRASE